MGWQARLLGKVILDLVLWLLLPLALGQLSRPLIGAWVGDLPETSVSADSKAALAALVAELPNPSGELVVRVTAKPGIGPVRFGGYAVTGVPATLAEAAPLFQGVTVDVEWTHGDAP